MLPYDELIKRLSGQAAIDRYYNGTGKLYEEAAAAIDHLQKAVFRLEEESGILDELPLVDQTDRCATCRYNGNVEFDACHICNNETDMYRPMPTNADRIKSAKTEEKLMECIFHALKMSKQYTDSRRGMVKWLESTQWSYPIIPADKEGE